MLQLRLAAALEVLDASVGREPGLLVRNGWELYPILTPSIRSLIILLSCASMFTPRHPAGSQKPTGS